MRVAPTLYRTAILGLTLLGLRLLPAEAAIQPAGEVTWMTMHTAGNFSPYYMFDTSEGGQLAVYPYADDVIRVRWHWMGLYEKDEIAIAKPMDQWPTTSSAIADLGDRWRIETGQLKVDIIKGPSLRVNLLDADGVPMLEDDRVEYDPAYHPILDASYIGLRWHGELPHGFKVKNVKKAPAEEAYFGLGEYSGPLNRRGSTIQMWNSDAFSWQENQSPLYMSFPFYYGVRPAAGDQPATAYGLFFNNPSRSVFRMGTEADDQVSFEGGDGQIDYVFFGGGPDHTMADVLADYTDLTGRPAMLPKWAFGYHMSKWSYDEHDVRNVVQQFRNHDIPLDAIYLDIDYFDQDADDHYDDDLFQLTWNHTFPNPAGMTDDCREAGVHVVAMVEPWLVPSDPKYTEAEQLGYFVKDNQGSTVLTDLWFGPGSWLDFTEGGTRSWWRSRVGSFMQSYGIDGIWNDLNETADDGQIPLNGLYSLDGRYGRDSINSARWHQNVKNTHAIYETSTSYAALQDAHPEKRPFVLSRGGFPGIQRYAAGWSGDNIADFQHLRHNIRVGTSVMMSGLVNFGHDIGGFVHSTTPELLARWHEWGALNPFFRNHYGKYDVAKEPYLYDGIYRNAMIRSIRLRYELMPYLYTLAHQSTVNGTPMNTPTVFHFPDDANTFRENDYDFMIGPGLLAAPVYQQGSDVRWIYLPDGADWYRFDDDTRLAGGGYHLVDAPIGRIPLFARKGSIIPMGPVLSHTGERNPEYLDIHVWPDDHAEFTLYEDDGTSWEFLSGAYASTRLTCDRTAAGYSIHKHARSGTYDPGARSLHFILHDVHAFPGDTVTVNGAELQDDSGNASSYHASSAGWMMDRKTGRLWIKINDTPDEIELSVTLHSNQDTDADGMPDVWEADTHLRPNDPTDAGDDPDHDGASNLDEYRQETDPHSPDIGPYASAYDAMTVSGSFNGWRADLKNMRMVDDHTWEARLVLDGNGLRFKFTGNGNWADNWGDNEGDTKSAPAQGTAERFGGDITFPGNLSGLYTIRFHADTGAYSLEKTIRTIQWIGYASHSPADGQWDEGESLGVRVETWPKGTAQSAGIVYSANDTDWFALPMSPAGTSGNNDVWTADLGTFPAGSVVQYALFARDAFGITKWNSNDGQNYHAAVNGDPAPALLWIGDTFHWPGDNELDAGDSLWINIDAYPRDAATDMEVVYTVDGTTWQSAAMHEGSPNGQNDHWYVNLGSFPSGTVITFAIVAGDAYGTTRWDNNGGTDFRATVR